MSLAAGTRIGPYEVLALLGAGGMGEVYRARDARLGRDVAIKALPAALQHDGERLARFEREARLLASLNHPNIAGIHGLEEAGGQRYLVLEFVEGQTLAQRLSAGPLPIDDALQVCRDIAAGVEAAHEGGVVHRDLKPGNVMLTPAGAVKVLDFGLAKSGGAVRDGGSDPKLSASPTMTYAATQAGMVLGTAAYMSPEQARGKSVDRRTDIWSFGCVLYECLCGKPVFDGETVSDLLARILERDPDWSALPARVPARIRELIRRCLVKDAKQRLRDIGDARLELEQVIALGISGTAAAAVESSATRRRGLPWWSVAAAAVVAVAATLLVQPALRPASVPVARRFEIYAPEPLNLVFDPVECAISPDGRMVAMVLADSAGTPHLWVRPIDSFKGRELPGTNAATQPFWSPDSRSLAFAASTKLKKIAINGGDAEDLCAIRSFRGGSWGRSGVILFAPTSNGPLYRIAAGGGDPQAVTQIDSTRHETAHRFPRFLPDGQHYLFSVLVGSTGRYSIQAGALGETRRREILTAGSGAEYAPQGYLLFTRNGVLSAQRFDAGSLRVSGDPISLGDSPPVPNTSGAPVVTASSDGTIAYTFIPLPSSRLVWLGLDGREQQQIPIAPGPYFSPLISPDGKSCLLNHAVSTTQGELLTVDLERGTTTRVSEETQNVENAEWSPDGKRVAYSVGGGGPQTLFVVPSDGSAPPEVVLPAAGDFRRLDGWTPDGKSLVFGRLDPRTNWDLWTVSVDGDHHTQPYLRRPANETSGSVSPDGRWLCYNSDESGRQEGYVQSFPTPGARFQVTTDGTGVIGWKRDGKALALLPTPDRFIHAVDVLPGAEFRVGPPRRFFHAPEQIQGADAAGDWSRILALMSAGKPDKGTIRVVLDWTAMLAKR
jgi:Tol biopolymer transport system component/tRNA A-37 threonylcarbamoyl transferase component Bud32